MVFLCDSEVCESSLILQTSSRVCKQTQTFHLLFPYALWVAITNSRSPAKPMSIESVMPSNHLILCCPLLLLPPIPLSIRVFPNESVLHIRWPKYWSFSFSISPSSEYSGLISSRMDWLDLLVVQGPLKSTTVQKHLIIYLKNLDISGHVEMSQSVNNN